MATFDYSSMRFLFAGILAATIIFSVAIVALGIWILSDSTLLSYWLNKIVVTDYGALTVTLRMTSYLPIGLGLIAILSFSIGVSHLLRGGRVLLVAYAVTAGMAAALEVVLTIVPIAMWSQVETELLQYMQRTLQSEYRDMSGGVSFPNSIIWDVMHIELECCGFNGPSDFTKYYATYASYWHTNHRFYQADSVTYSGMSYMFPVSCCKFSSKSILTSLDFANYENFVANKQCPVIGADYFNNSCQQPLKDYVYLFFCVILATSFVMLLLHAAALALAVALLKKRMVPAGDELDTKVSRLRSGSTVAPEAYQPRTRGRTRGRTKGEAAATGSDKRGGRSWPR